MMPSSLYVHIPFCHHICAYCDFAKVYYNEAWANRYLDYLGIELVSREAKRPFETVFIGGGSPSALNEKQLAKLLDLLKEPLSHCEEATIEVNPEDMTLEKAQLLANHHINRVSIGVQTFNEAILQRLGRKHTFNDIKQTLDYLQQVGIHRISFDFIYGLPNQTLEDLKQDLAILKQCPSVTHVSFYTLILEEHTRFANEGVTLPDDEWLLEAQQVIVQELQAQDFERYEVSNYAKEGQQSLHNKVYWHNRHYIGVGCGASGYIGDLRYDNTKSLQRYLKGETTANETLLTKEDMMFESLMLGLRLCEGLSISNFKERYGIELFNVYGKTLKRYLDLNYLVIEHDYLKTTPKGMDILDEILISLMN